MLFYAIVFILLIQDQNVVDTTALTAKGIEVSDVLQVGATVILKVQ
jgi:hypothetical protein